MNHPLVQADMKARKRASQRDRDRSSPEVSRAIRAVLEPMESRLLLSGYPIPLGMAGEGVNVPPVISGTVRSPAIPTNTNAVWVTSTVADDSGVAGVKLTYSTGSDAMTSVFTETMGTTPAKSWTGVTGSDHAWAVTGTYFELATAANYLTSTTECGILYKGKASTNPLTSAMVATTNNINAAGSSGYVEFYVKTQTLDGTDGWTFQVDSGSGFVTRLSELTGSSHNFQKYHYDLASSELVNTLMLRFQFTGGGANDTNDRISVDQIAVKVVSGSLPVDVTMLDDGAHGDGAVGDSVYGGQIPAMPTNTVVSYYVTATDNTGQQVVDPAGAPSTKYSYTVIDAVPFDGSIVLGSPTDTSITLNVLSTDQNRDVYFAYGIAPGTYATQTANFTLTAGKPLVVRLESLVSDTPYYYRMYSKPTGASASQLTATEEYRFHTQRGADSTFIFSVQGDSHPERSQQFDAALYTQTLLTAAADHPDFYLTIGDDFSVDTLNYLTITQQQVAERYLLQRPYLGLIGNSAPLFLVNGNHEQAARYLLDGTPNNVAVWAQNARNLYYAEPAPDSFYTGNLEDVPYIDGGKLRDYFAWTWGDALFVTIDPYWSSPTCVDNPFNGGPKRSNLWDVQHGDAQYDWLKTTLEQSTAKYKFVFAHHVLGTGRGGADIANGYEWGGYSVNGTWGFDVNRPNWAMPIQQLMAANGVTAFIQGHDHIFVDQELDGVHYITLPEPADPNYTLYNADAFTTNVQAKASNTGYTRFTVSPDGVRVEYVRTFLPADETLGRTSGMVAAGFTLAAPTGTPVITGRMPSLAVPTASDPVWATSMVTDDGSLSSVTLTYNSIAGEISMTMHDDGLHGDGAAGDHVYGAQIPAQSAGTMVRYSITAVDNQGNHATSTMSYTVAPCDVILGRPTNDSVAISVTARSSQVLTFYVAYGTTSGVYTGQTSSQTITAGGVVTLDLTGLGPDTQYYYQVYYRVAIATEFTAGPERMFHTQRAAGETFTFDVQADIHHSDASSNSLAVYQATAGNIVADRPDFLVDLGDTFMTEKYGVNTQAGILAAVQATRTDDLSLVGDSTPLLLATGNHESELGWLIDSAQPTANPAVWATEARQAYFPPPIPGGFYSGSNTTDPYMQAARNSYYAFTWGNAECIVLDPFWYTSPKPSTAGQTDCWGWTLGQAQYQWLAQTLAASQSRFKFVFIHHLVGGGFDGVARGGVEFANFFEWGGRNEDGSWGFGTHRPGWAMPIQNLLLTYGVDVVFHGHDHLFVKQDLDANADGNADLVYLECPQPANANYNSTSTAPGYGYATYVPDNAGNSGLQSNSGHIRVTVAATTATIEYVRAYAVQDQTSQHVNGSVAYSFSLAARTDVNHAPTVTTAPLTMPPGLTWTGGSSFFTEHFTDPDAGNTLQQIRIDSLPNHGELKLGASTVTLNQLIESAQLRNLSYVPGAGYIGNDVFTWNGSDGSLWAAAAAACQLALGPVGGVLTLYDGPYHFSTDLDVTWPGVAVTVPTGGSVVFTKGQNLPSLTVESGGSVGFSAGMREASRLGSLIIAGSGVTLGRLDLADSNLVLSYTGSSPAQTVRELLLAGRVFGTGIISSTGTQNAPAAIGLVDNALIHQVTWGGVTISNGWDYGQLILQRTLPGDTNLDGKVDQFDYLNIIASMGSSNSQWFMGDLNYDGVVTADDLAEVTSHLNLSFAFVAGPAISATRSSSAKPFADTAAKANRLVAKKPTKKPAKHLNVPRPLHFKAIR